MVKITKKRIQKWVKALRSGKYKQGRGALQSKKGYCCLGVLCKITIPEKDLSLNCEGRLLGLLPGGQGNSREWTKQVNIIFDDKTGTDLVTLNDNKKLTFDEIADSLEAVFIHKVMK